MTDVFDTNVFHFAIKAVCLMHRTDTLMRKNVLISLAPLAVVFLWYDDHNYVY